MENARAEEVKESPSITIREWPKPDKDWTCYMFGSIPGDYGSLVYKPYNWIPFNL